MRALAESEAQRQLLQEALQREAEREDESPSPSVQRGGSKSLGSSAGEEHFAHRLQEATEEVEILRKENESMKSNGRKLEEQLKKAQALNVKWRASQALEPNT